MILMQISSAQGPVECCQGVAHALQRICAEAEKNSVIVHIVEKISGPAAGTYRSVLLTLEGKNEATLAQRWCGSIQWICSSNFRTNHPRKNWFIGITTFTVEQSNEVDMINNVSKGLVFESMRSGGPGGQHVNTTESAIRATHTATGISVKVQTERSQHANKRLAILLITHKLQERQSNIQMQQRAQQRIKHHQVERGNAVLTFKGADFEEC